MLENHEYVIFATTTMLYQLSQSKQYFIDGTFSIAPPGFQQVLILLCLLPEHNLFYPSCFILLTSKSERAYTFAFDLLQSVARQHGSFLLQN